MIESNDDKLFEDEMFQVRIDLDNDTGLLSVSFPVASVIDTDNGPAMGFRITPFGLVQFGNYLSASAGEVMHNIIGELCGAEFEDDEDDDDD